MHRAIGSSFRSARCRRSYIAFAHGWNGATLSASEILSKRPSSVIGTLAAEFSTNAFALAVPQYPFLPAGGPSFTWPSGQRGAGAGAAAARRVSGGPNNRFAVLVKTTDLADACRASLLAG